jgi:histidyl-tRNA synthetase
VRGTRDILPQECGSAEVEASAREILGRANYQEIRTPHPGVDGALCPQHCSATDVVGKEMYSFSTRGEQR